MITWIQTITQKHHKTVFGILLFAIIIAFVFTVGSVPFLGDRNRGSYETSKKNFFGFDLSNAGVVQHFQTCVYFEMTTDGIRADTDEQWNMLVMRQAYLLSVARELGLSDVSQKELDTYIKSRPAFMSRDGNFDSSLWQSFVSRFTQQGRMSVESLNSILSNNALVDKASTLVGGPGYIGDSEIKSMYNSLFGDWTVELATLSLSKVKAPTLPSVEELEKFFKRNAESYRVPEGYIFDVVFESSENYKSQVAAPSEADLAAYFAANSADYAQTKDGKRTIPALANVVDKVRADYISSLATSMAVAKLEDVAMKIYESKAKKDSSEFKTILSDSKIKLRRLQTIRADNKESLSQLPAKALEAAVALDENHYYSDTIATPGGAWLVFLAKKEASYIPQFANIKKKVEENWIADAKIKAFTEQGAELVAKTKKSEGKDFASVMKKAGANVQKLSDISLTKPSPDMQKAGMAAQLLYSVLPNMKSGEISQMMVAGDSGYVVFVEKYISPKLDVKSREFISFRENVRSRISAICGSVVMQDMISAAEKTLEKK